MEACYICRVASDKLREVPLVDFNSYEIVCPTCGHYRITAEAVDGLQFRSEPDRCTLSGWVREQSIRRRVPFICSDEYGVQPGGSGRFIISEILETHAPRTVAEALERALLNLGEMSHEPGARLKLSSADWPVCLARTTGQMMFYLDALNDAGFLKDYCARVDGGGELTVSPAGWNRIAELRSRSTASIQVFVAMSFAEEMDNVYHEGLSPGIKDAGYEPLRVDMQEHNEKICDLIIAEIRKSRFLVADVTMQRQGVYYEAGFAQGLGLPVVWTCRDDDSKNCHFDTRQYNHIMWSNPDELRQALKNRIEATIV